MSLRGQGLRVARPGMWLASIEFGSEWPIATRAWVEVWSEDERLLTESVVNVLVGPWRPPIFSERLSGTVVLRAEEAGIRAKVVWRNQDSSTVADVAVPFLVEPAPPDPKQERIAELEAALHALVDDAMPVYHDELSDVVPLCAYCQGLLSYFPGRASQHDPDCPVAKARALLGMKGEG